MAKFAVLNTVAATLSRWESLLVKGLSFEENLVGSEWEGTIAAGEERRITHDLGVVPTRFAILQAKGVNTVIQSRLRNPTAEFFWVQNIASTSSFTGKIQIMP